MQSEAPLTLLLSPLRAGRGELERTGLGSLFGDADAVPPKGPLPLSKRERVRVRVRLDCMVTAKADAAAPAQARRHLLDQTTGCAKSANEIGSPSLDTDNEP